jgi:hypothetical protein
MLCYFLGKGSLGKLIGWLVGSHFFSSFFCFFFGIIQNLLKFLKMANLGHSEAINM